MALKSFFKGKSGAVFWMNIVLMAVVIVVVPLAAFYMLDGFTHHGEKIEVPSVIGKSLYDAENMLDNRGLVAIVVDSAYDKGAKPGAVLEQSPKPGYEVKGGRVIYLTLNLRGEPMVQLPDVVSHGSLREAVALLGSLGFRLTPHQAIMGRPKDLVIGVKQGGREVHPGEILSRERVLTLMVGGGEVDTLMVERMDSLDEVDMEEGGEDFDIDL